MTRTIDRRHFLHQAAGIGLGAAALPLAAAEPKKEPPFLISLAQWSLHRALFGKKLDPLDFAKTAKQDYGIDAVEYVNQFYKGKATDKDYTAEIKKRAEGEGVKSVLIMCDGEGALGDPDAKKRQQAVENHYKWVELARYLGCHSIRVNAHSSGSPEEQMELAADGLRKLTEFGAKHEINVIVENHGGLSSNGEWLVGVMKKVDHPRCGTLPDFGNFGSYDRYKGVQEMMPYAKGVSAKSYAFDAEGNETTIDYPRMMKIVLGAGYHGRVGIEFEGSKVSEPEGIRATKKLLERIRAEVGG
jgi:sugar phosphate isomerase/epimerase